MVLPSTKASEQDVVVWLDASQAAAEADEAEQRGAVVALHTLAGQRNLQVGAARAGRRRRLGAWDGQGRWLPGRPELRPGA